MIQISCIINQQHVNTIMLHILNTYTSNCSLCFIKKPHHPTFPKHSIFSKSLPDTKYHLTFQQIAMICSRDKRWWKKDPQHQSTTELLRHVGWHKKLAARSYFCLPPFLNTWEVNEKPTSQWKPVILSLILNNSLEARLYPIYPITINRIARNWA